MSNSFLAMPATSRVQGKQISNSTFKLIHIHTHHFLALTAISPVDRKRISRVTSSHTMPMLNNLNLTNEMANRSLVQTVATRLLGKQI